MVESDHGETMEEAKTTMNSGGGGDAESKKGEIVGKRPREDLLEDEARELPNKRPRSETNDHPAETDKETVSEILPKANGSATHKGGSMEIDGEEISDEKTNIPLAKSEEKINEADSPEDKEIHDNANYDKAVNSDKSEQKNESIESKDEKSENMEKNDVSSEEKAEDEEDDEIDEEGDSSSKEKETVEKALKPSVSKSKTKDLEVVDGLEMSVECASDKDASSSENEEETAEKKKLRPKTEIVKAKPRDSELDASTSEGEKSDNEDNEEKSETKKTKGGKAKGGKASLEGKGRKRGKKKGFTKVNSSESEDSDDNESEDEDYSPRTKKKMKKTSPSKKSPAKTPGKRRGRAPKKLAKRSEDEQSDEQEDDDVNLDKRSKKSKKSQKKASGSENDDKSEEESSETTRKNGKKSKARPEDDRRIQALKKYLPLAGITVRSYEQFWAGCNTNTARLARMKEALAEQGVTGRPTLDKCKKAKARKELREDAASLGPVENLGEGRVTRARGGKKTASPKADTPSRRDGRGGYKRVKSSIVDSESE